MTLNNWSSDCAYFKPNILRVDIILYNGSTCNDHDVQPEATSSADSSTISWLDLTISRPANQDVLVNIRNVREYPYFLFVRQTTNRKYLDYQHPSWSSRSSVRFFHPVESVVHRDTCRPTGRDCTSSTRALVSVLIPVCSVHFDLLGFLHVSDVTRSNFSRSSCTIRYFTLLFPGCACARARARARRNGRRKKYDD